VENIKMNLRQIGWDGMYWMDLAKDRDQCMAVENTAMNVGSIECWEVPE
jgi:hypothetical protein